MSTQFEIEVTEVPELNRSNTTNELAEAKTADDVAELINGDVTDGNLVADVTDDDLAEADVADVESTDDQETAPVNIAIENPTPRNEQLRTLAVFEDGYHRLSDEEAEAFKDAFEKYIRLQWKAEEDHEAQVKNLKEAHTSASLIRSRIEGELKAAKKTEKSILGELETLLASGPEGPEKPTPDMFVGKGADSILEPTSPLSQSGATQFDFSQDETWRNISTELVLEKITSGLGPKKSDAILSEFPTLGALIECKIEASNEFVHFSNKLPKGVGVELADHIEDAIEATLAIHRKRLIEQAWDSTVPAAEDSESPDSVIEPIIEPIVEQAVDSVSESDPADEEDDDEEGDQNDLLDDI